jgi:hypothetical protein
MVSSDWSQRIRITGEVQSIKVKHEHKQAWGTLVHSCLASLNSLADLEKVIAFQTEKSQLSEEDSLLLTQKLKSTLEHPQLERYFSNGLVAKNEAAILTPSGNMYRPDRVVFLEDETCIIEFKTGLPDQEHEKQLLNYAGLLAGMGYSGITKLLVYLDNETIVKKL